MIRSANLILVGNLRHQGLERGGAFEIKSRSGQKDASVVLFYYEQRSIDLCIDILASGTMVTKSRPRCALFIEHNTLCEILCQ